MPSISKQNVDFRDGTRRLSGAIALALLVVSSLPVSANEPMHFGFGQIDITPDTTMRLSGYGSRQEPYEGIDGPLQVRAMAIQTSDKLLHVMVSIDTIGLPGSLVNRMAKKLQSEHDIARDRFVICFTHTHTAPHIAGGLTNIFAKPLTHEETENAQHYAERVFQAVLSSVNKAISELAIGTLHFSSGRIEFAQNRRVLQNGKWSGFGVNPDGPVDHSLPLLQIRGADNKVRGVVFNYACHCTTFGGTHNRVNGDWAGYAAAYLEEAFPGATALCVIGCGADANPPRDNERAAELVKGAGKVICKEVQRLAELPSQPITAQLTTALGYADLPFDLPSVDDLRQRLDDTGSQARRHAQNMLQIVEEKGALPKSYPAPIQVWCFGNELTMVFLSGEVVVDYALRLQRENDSGGIWVSAYCNDLFAYLASERVRREGGYEVDGSMIYYNQPGPWAQDTEQVVYHKIEELVRQVRSDQRHDQSDVPPPQKRSTLENQNPQR